MAKRILAQAPWIAPDFVPETYGRLTSICSKYKPAESKYVLQDWKCECGKVVTRYHSAVRYGTTSSCGCIKSEQLAARNKASARHGYFGTATYRSWSSMIVRCEDVTHEAYYRYGGRGIKICKEWREDFCKFLKDMGERPADRTLDRIDTNGDYCPENCRWATKLEQARNTRSNRRLTLDGVTKLLVEWAEEYEIPGTVISARLKAGWSVRDALTVPPSKRCTKRGDSTSA